MTQWKIGEVAKRTGLTVRTLHHYDEIGLLVPSDRTGAGYRLYGDADLARLYRILALRGMGFPLDAVGEVLGHQGGDPRPAIRDHLDRLEKQLALTEQLRSRLTGVLAALDRAAEPSPSRTGPACMPPSRPSGRPAPSRATRGSTRWWSGGRR
jgi:DNA-binding transcriptional MerR regulator